MEKMFQDCDLDNDIFRVPWDMPDPPKNVPLSPKTKRSSVKRKFPGPAGLLSAGVQSQATINEVSCSQCHTDDISRGPWEQMSKDLRLLNDRHVYLPDKYNIAWVKAAAKSDRLINRKAPFLAGIIHKINTKPSIVTIVLKDPSGKINCTIVNSLYEDYQKHLIVGSVITLRQVGVLMTSTSNYYLTIASNNLVSIYNGDGVIRRKWYTAEDFWKNINAVRALHRNRFDLNTRNTSYVKPLKEVTEALNSTQLSHDEEILQNVFEGVDADSFFDDF